MGRHPVDMLNCVECFYYQFLIQANSYSIRDHDYKFSAVAEFGSVVMNF